MRKEWAAVQPLKSRESRAKQPEGFTAGRKFPARRNVNAP